MARILTTEMGKTFAAAKAEVSKCAIGLRWFADNAEALLADEAIPTTATRSYVHYQPHRRRAGRHAVELPDVAGDPLRRAGPHGGQRRPAQARVQRAADRPGHRGPVPAGGPARGRVHQPVRRVQGRRGAHRGSAHCRGDADRERARRHVGGLGRRRSAEEERARARRLRPLHRLAVGRPRGDRADRRGGPRAEQRPVVHRGQALHRRGRGGRRVPEPFHRGDGRAGGG